MTSWAAVAKSARVVAAAARAGVKHRPSNAHSPLCARKGGRKHPCTCGATARSKAGEDLLRRQLAVWGIVAEPGFVEFDVPYIAGRNFRGDVVLYRPRIVIERQGFARGYGPHGGIAKAKADIEKHALSAAHGWRVLPVTSDTVKDGSAIRYIFAAVAWRTRPS